MSGLNYNDSVVLQPDFGRVSPVSLGVNVKEITPGTFKGFDPEKDPYGAAPPHVRMSEEYLPGGVREQTWNPAKDTLMTKQWPDPSKGWSCKDNNDWSRGNQFSMRWPSLSQKIEYGVEVPVMKNPTQRALVQNYFYPYPSFGEMLDNPDNYTYPITQNYKYSEPDFGKPFYSLEGFENLNYMNLTGISIIIVLLVLVIFGLGLKIKFT